MGRGLGRVPWGWSLGQRHPPLSIAHMLPFLPQTAIKAIAAVFCSALYGEASAQLVLQLCLPLFTRAQGDITPSPTSIQFRNYCSWKRPSAGSTSIPLLCPLAASKLLFFNYVNSEQEGGGHGGDRLSHGSPCSHVPGEQGWTALPGAAMTPSTLLQGWDRKEKAMGEKKRRGKKGGERTKCPTQYFAAGGRVERQAGEGTDLFGGTPHARQDFGLHKPHYTPVREIRSHGSCRGWRR